MNDNQQIDNGKPEVNQSDLDRAEEKFRRAQKTFWDKLVGAFTRVDYPAGHVSPHAGARRKTKNARKKRKRRRLMVRRSRKINRRR